MSAGPTRPERQISLPLSQAYKIALRNITIRLGRAMITASGTLLGIAFLMSVFTGNEIQVARGTIIEAAQQNKNTWLVIMSLLVTVVGITNAMLMSVTERYKEIGTIKCLGALDNFIVKLFLIESALLGFFGSLIGALLGALIMLLTATAVWGDLNWLKLLVYLAVCVVIGTALSVLAAIAPALRAAKMQAIDAMRTEV
jgi:ABC-type lipoprotein release transport system permease subunit